MRHSLRQLEVFLAIARVESVSQAAETLGMSQSAASGSLLDLERQFSVQLFERVGKRLKLNELGRSIRPRAEAVLEHAGELERALESRSDTGPLRVGATMTIGNYLAVPLLAQYTRQYPGTTPTLVIANTEEIARQIANFELDVALIEGAVANDEHLHLIRRVRQRTKHLVSFGDCAVTGNVTAMRNPLGTAEPVLRRAYLEGADIAAQIPAEPGILPVLLDRVLPVHGVVHVDTFLSGCPPPADRIRSVLEQVLAGKQPVLAGRDLKAG